MGCLEQPWHVQTPTEVSKTPIADRSQTSQTYLLGEPSPEPTFRSGPPIHARSVVNLLSNTDCLAFRRFSQRGRFILLKQYPTDCGEPLLIRQMLDKQ